MLRNYLKLAFRNMRLFKTYSLINIVSLSIGLASCFIILLYVAYQLSYDKHNKKLNNTYLVYSERPFLKISEPATPPILGATLKNEFPEVIEIARYANMKDKVRYKDKEFDERKFVLADPALFNILTLPIISGSIGRHNSDKYNVVISETMAKKYFGSHNPIGETMTIQDYGNDYDFTVTAVMKDVPSTSTFSADFIGSFTLWEELERRRIAEAPKNLYSAWDFPSVKTYIQLAASCNAEDFEKKLERFSENHKRYTGKEKVVYRVFPIKNLFFYSSFMTHNDFPKGSIQNIYIYSTVALLILFISVITFLMFSVGRASLRTKEIGVRKVIGALKRDLFKQIIVESLVLTLLSLPLMIFLIELFLTKINPLVGLDISSDYFHNWQYLFILFFITVLVGVMAGSYVSLFLAKFNPVDILKNSRIVGSKRNTFRKIMLACQMTIVAGLIIVSITIYKQLRYFYNKDFGFNKEQLIIFHSDDHDIGKTNLTAFKNELMLNNNIISISGGTVMPGTNSKSETRLSLKNSPELLTSADLLAVELFSVDQDFIETMGIKILKGNSFKNKFEHDSISVCLVNETAVKNLGVLDPIGKKIMDMKIIGVVNDFNAHSLHENISPMVIREKLPNMNEIAVRMRPGNIIKTIDFVREKSAKYNLGRPMSFQFYDDRLGELYKEEERFANVIGFFTGLAIFVACLGLFGMSMFVIQQRVKEIGIRKILGASLKNIFFMITKEFILIAVTSSLIAFPLAFYLMNNWLQNFAYRISFDVWIFILACSGAMMIVLVTVSVQAIKAAVANPVESLRYE